MGRKQIYEKDAAYSILKYYVDCCIRHSYRRIEVSGKENIPDDGAVIIAPNHCNTLMDALVVLQAFEDETVFGARADMFNNRFIAKIMFFVRILPMVRQRDGLRNVLKNYETQEIIVETLKNDVRFCMFPEGRHRPTHSLLPLGKGVFRSALAASAELGEKKPVYIVPAGIEYGDYFRYRGTCLVSFGEPINVTDFIKNHEVDSEAQLMEPLKNELRHRMSKLISYIESSENYTEKWSLTKILARPEARKGSLADMMTNNRRILNEIEKLAEKNPETMTLLLEKAGEFEKKRKKKGLSIWSFAKDSLFTDVLTAVLGIPYFVFAALASLPMWLVFELLKLKIKDKAFRNTAGFGIKLVMGPLMLIMWAILAFCNAPWWLAIMFTLLTIPSYTFVYDYAEFIRIFISDLKLLRNRKMARRFEDIRNEFNKMNQ